ncbi:MAG TPA: DUF2007 domain-containing protein [Gemmata sp.]
MAGKLVTIARFDLAGQAHLAKNALDEAGIKAVLADEVVVAMDWLLSNAVGGIKVQVLEEDADRSLAVLEAALGSDEPVDEETMATEAEAAEREVMDVRDDLGAAHTIAPDSEPPAPPAPDALPEVLSERDEYARRALLAAFFGLVVPLLWFYAVYLFFNAAFGAGPISTRYQNRLLAIGGLLTFGFFVAMYLISVYGDPFP